MPAKRIINREDYPMVTPEGWEIYKNTKTLLPCKCVVCGNIIYKSINTLDNNNKSCLCFNCSFRRIINKENYPPVMDWSGYKTTKTKLPCKCPQCGKIVPKSICNLDAGCFLCRECADKNTGTKSRISINKDDFSMVKDWSNYKNKNSKLMCICESCGIIVYKTISHLEKEKSCYCRKCGMKFKFKKTCLKKFGVENPFQSQKIKNKIKKTRLKKFGVEYSMQLKETINKVVATKRKNGTFNTSKTEDLCYYLLCDLYGEMNIKRNYNKDSRYPFQVDFYIISIDTFIECNFFFSHGKELFNPENEKHQQILNEWKEKKSEFYNNCITTWTIKDPLKLKTAKKNNLNYLSFYTIKDFENWLFIEKDNYGIQCRSNTL